MTFMPSRERTAAALKGATQTLMSEMGPGGYWEGCLSSSALSTATAVIALARLPGSSKATGDDSLVARGLRWLASNQNGDGGWGDTTLSYSNISTTALAWAAFAAAQGDASFPAVVMSAQKWLQAACGSDAEGWERQLVGAIRRRYGKDHTFSVPIITACTLAGRLGKQGWQEVPALPFELAALPHAFYGALRLPVVSYALPALIAIGLSIHHHAPTRNPVLRLLRNSLRNTAASKLERLQPDNGGFLEATPLTSFVLMNLTAIGEAETCTARRAAEFLRKSVRDDGSWPIDTNLSTWVSTWAVNSLQAQQYPFSYEHRTSLKEWLLKQQYQVQHPYTNAAPGGWAWTDLPGGVPDADDTPGALLALLALGTVDAQTRFAGELGTRWLLDLQNRDGGIPTFCKGWGALPFDRSGCDLTAHVLRAWVAWLPHLDEGLRSEVHQAIPKALAYLNREQRADGTWVPLWFGHQDEPDEQNVLWGTARVVLALRNLRNNGLAIAPEMLTRGTAAIVSMQQPDGGWAGGFSKRGESCVEQTALAVEALAGTQHTNAVARGVCWLVEKVENGSWVEPSPIGFYFAKLWYYERLYPQLTTVAALGAVLRDTVL